MKKLIAAAAALVLGFAALAHAPSRAHAKASASAPAAVAAPAVEAPLFIELPEQTIAVAAPSHHAAARAVETDAQHVARLMATPLRCGDYEASAGTGEIAGTSGSPRVARCTVGR
jgi:hypothetical protein